MARGHTLPLGGTARSAQGARMSTTIDVLASSTAGAGTKSVTSNEAGSADRFLKLLVP